MARITDVPLEVHEIILDDVIGSSSLKPLRKFSCQVLNLVEKRRQSPDPESSYPSLDSQLSSIFPHNLALTCTFWRSILTRSPQVWGEVIIFDLTLDPFPLLDVFTWSKHEEIEVVVFTSASNPTEVDKTRERKRVAAIAQALRPHVHRCSSITFNVMFASSLPSLTLLLWKEESLLMELAVECLVDDIDMDYMVDNNASIFATAGGIDVLPNSFPNLHVMKLAGMSFMELCMLPGSHDWFEGLETLGNSDLDLHISRFSFQNEFDDHAHYTVNTFLSCLARIKDLHTLYLSHLSLSYEWVDKFPTPFFMSQFHSLRELRFDAVSKDFLTALFRLINCDATDGISYSRCAIPRILQVHLGQWLELDNIIDDSHEREDGVIENSLHRVLATWEGTNLTVRSCPSFNDGLLEWLSSKVQYLPYCRQNIAFLDHSTFLDDSIVYLDAERSSEPIDAFPADRLSTLFLHNCTNYSLSAFRRLVEIRKEEERSACHWMAAIGAMSMNGKIPSLQQVDLDWMKEKTEVSNEWMGLVEGGETPDEVHIMLKF